jgi:hypothetical protein
VFRVLSVMRSEGEDGTTLLLMFCFWNNWVFWKQMLWHQKQLNCLNMSLTFGSRRAWRVETKPPIFID